MHTPTTRPPHNRRTSQAPVAAHGAPGRPAQRPRHGATSVLRQRGLTLIEVLVALLLGLLLIGAVGGLYLANHQTFRQVENMARINENARLAFELLGRDLREAGGMVCGGNLPTAWGIDWGQGLQGFNENQALPARDFGNATGDRRDGTDAVVVWSGTLNPALDCPATGGSWSELHVSAWYIGFNSRGGFSLYRIRLDYSVADPLNPRASSGPEEMIENVRNLQLVYLESDGGALGASYVDANRVNDWRRVQAVRLALTYQSAEAVGTNAQPITRILPFVVGLRNRLP